ncbi:MAG: acetylornithine deacetylase [Pseudomonadota bacterium]
MPGRLDETLNHLEALVGFDTVSAHSNLPLIAYVEGFLADHGLTGIRVPNADGEKTSLFVTLGPSASIDNGDVSGIGLSAHTDVVPVEGQDWTTDPFALTRRGDRVFGRGTCDMKGYIACILAAVPEWAAAPLRQPIHILLSYDEEVGCRGVRPMIDALGAELPRPSVVIVGEPTSMSVVDAHKGAARFETHITGREAHSSMSHIGVNAIEYGARFVAHLREIEAALPENPHAERFTPPKTTLHVGRMGGGRAMNIVPRDCRIDWECRPLPGVSATDILTSANAFANDVLIPEMRAVDPEATIDTHVTNDIPAFDAGNDSPAVSLAFALAGQNNTAAVSYMTEASWFQHGGCPTAVCGRIVLAGECEGE